MVSPSIISDVTHIFKSAAEAVAINKTSKVSSNIKNNKDAYKANLDFKEQKLDNPEFNDGLPPNCQWGLLSQIKQNQAKEQELQQEKDKINRSSNFWGRLFGLDNFKASITGKKTIISHNPNSKDDNQKFVSQEVKRSKTNRFKNFFKGLVKFISAPVRLITKPIIALSNKISSNPKVADGVKLAASVGAVAAGAVTGGAVPVAAGIITVSGIAINAGLKAKRRNQTKKLSNDLLTLKKLKDTTPQRQQKLEQLQELSRSNPQNQSLNILYNKLSENRRARAEAPEAKKITTNTSKFKSVVEGVTGSAMNLNSH